MADNILALPFRGIPRACPAELDSIRDCLKTLHRNLRQFDRLCRLASETGAFRPAQIRTYCEDFDLGTLSLPGCGRGLTTSELAAHLELVLGSMVLALDPAFPMPSRLVQLLRKAQVEAISTLTRIIGYLQGSRGAATALGFDIEEYRLMLQFSKGPLQRLGALTGYSIRLSAEIARRVDMTT